MSEIIYIDVNLSTTTAGLNNVGTFVNRSQPILEDPENYYVSVAKLVLSTSFSIPLWQPILNTTAGLNDGYNTIYSLSLRYGAFSSSQTYLRIIQDDDTIPIPVLPLTAQPSGANYGWGNVYSYFTICNMLNTAIATAYAELFTLVPTLDALPPYYTWDTSTELFSLNCYPMTQYDSSVTTNVVLIYFNNEFQPFLTGWTFSRLTNNVNTPNGQDCELIIQNQSNNWLPQASPPTQYPTSPSTTLLKMVQDFPAPFAFVALSSLQVLASLPFQTAELTSLPLALNGVANNNLTSLILTDFSVDYSSGGAGAFQQPIIYTPTSVINSRPIKLTGHNPVTQFGIQINWVNLAGVVSPLQSIGVRNMSIKLAFIKNEIVENSGFEEDIMIRKVAPKVKSLFTGK
jgi:hypothetical protein